MKSVRPAHAASLLAFACFSPSIVHAQPAVETVDAQTGEDAADQASDASVASFDPDFFSSYNPVTAADMVSRVPGFTLDDGDDRRGFGGAAGNLLINGERPSSKTGASELLKRIPASSVAKIELLSGASSDVDVRGQSQLVNVVLVSGDDDKGSTSYSVGLRHIQYSNRLGWRTQVSRSVPLTDTVDLSFDIQTPTIRGRSDASYVLRDGDGALVGTREQDAQPNNLTVKGAASLRWKPSDNDMFNFNVEVSPTFDTLSVAAVQRDPNGELASTFRGETEYDPQYDSEIGADWEHAFSDRLSVKLLALASLDNVEQYDVFRIGPDFEPQIIRTQDRSATDMELVGRVQTTWAATTAHTLEFGGEIAFNSRDTTLAITNQLPGEEPVPVDLAVADARVEELRGELFVTDVWTVSPQLAVETGFNFEASRITQSGDQAKEREFTYPKPRMTANYTMENGTTLRASLERDVAQLDFAEFSSAVDFSDASATIGNPDLVPEKAWKTRFEWEQRIGPRSALSIAAFYDRVEDVHDLVDVDGFDAYGNIGDGTRAGFEGSVSMPLDWTGLKNAELRLEGLFQQTNVDDPITGDARSFSVSSEREGSGNLRAGNKDWSYFIDYRQELPGLSASWGVSLWQWAGRSEYRRAEIIDYDRKTPRLDMFIETTRIQPVTIRLFTANLLGSREDRVRTFFDGDRSSGDVVLTEYRDLGGGPNGSRLVGFQVSGSF